MCVMVLDRLDSDALEAVNLLFDQQANELTFNPYLLEIQGSFALLDLQRQHRVRSWSK